MHILLGVIAATIIAVMLRRKLRTMPPEQKQKAMTVIGIVMVLMVVMLLLVRGAPLLAGVVGGMGGFYVLFQRIMQIASVARMAKSLFGGKPKQKTSPYQSEKDMTVRQACDILGVDERANEEEILQAYRKLIKKNHPDKGGSTYLAEQINQAKTVLLNKNKNT